MKLRLNLKFYMVTWGTFEWPVNFKKLFQQLGFSELNSIESIEFEEDYF